MLLKGVEYMIIGMSVVFIFLGLLVLVLMCVSRVFHRNYGSQTGGVAPPAGEEGGPAADEELAVVLAAVTDHERRMGE